MVKSTGHSVKNLAVNAAMASVLWSMQDGMIYEIAIQLKTGLRGDNGRRKRCCRILSKYGYLHSMKALSGDQWVAYRVTPSGLGALDRYLTQKKAPTQ